MTMESMTRIGVNIVIASGAKQSRLSPLTDSGLLRRFAPRNDDGESYRIGGAYCTPPAFQSWFIPRGIFSLDFSPMLRSYISP